jgi:hypothetical protein
VTPTTSPTSSPFLSPTSSPTNETRRELEVELEIELEDDIAFAYLTEEEVARDLCVQVDWKLIDNSANREMCKNYLELPYIKNDAATCSNTPTAKKVPKTLFSVSKDSEQSLVQIGVSASNPDFERRHFGDAEALEFVREHCGENVAHAYECLAPPAFRADLFRFCALFSEGGVYLDSDILPLVPIEDLYDPCAEATVGHDWPQGRAQKQMKILAGKPGAPIFGCMVDKIVNNIVHRIYPDNSLAITGPMALQECYEEYSVGVSVTYHDTREAARPWGGMRDISSDVLLALETPEAAGSKNYRFDFMEHGVYRPTCALKVEEPAKPAMVTDM